MKLSELKPGSKAKIVSLATKSGIKRRLQDMGVLPGEVVEVLKVAPFGDPVEVKVKGYSLSLRKSEAEDIEVEVLE